MAQERRGSRDDRQNREEQQKEVELALAFELPPEHHRRRHLDRRFDAARDPGHVVDQPLDDELGGKGGDRDKGKGGDAPRRGGFFRRRRVCKFCAEKIDYINYKDVRLLAPFLPERGKIQPRRISGTCALHQRKLQTAIKRARSIALLPYATD